LLRSVVGVDEVLDEVVADKGRDQQANRHRRRRREGGQVIVLEILQFGQLACGRRQELVRQVIEVQHSETGITILAHALQTLVLLVADTARWHHP
jgi:hypothetical protein